MGARVGRERLVPGFHWPTIGAPGSAMALLDSGQLSGAEGRGRASGGVGPEWRAGHRSGRRESISVAARTADAEGQSLLGCSVDASRPRRRALGGAGVVTEMMDGVDTVSNARTARAETASAATIRRREGAARPTIATTTRPRRCRARRAPATPARPPAPSIRVCLAILDVLRRRRADRTPGMAHRTPRPSAQRLAPGEPVPARSGRAWPGP